MIEGTEANGGAESRGAMGLPGRGCCGANWRSSALLTIAGVMLVSLTAWWGWQTARQFRTNEALPQSFRVQGSSMVPTLLGEFRTARCSPCKLGWLVDVSAETLGEASLACPHCGDLMSLDHAGQVDRSLPTTGADTVTIDSISNNVSVLRGLAPGDLVAVREDGQLHVKRVVAVPGDRVSLDGLRLLVNGHRVEDSLQGGSFEFPVPWMLVDDDVRRKQSRWSAVHEPTDVHRAWTREVDGRWRCLAGESRAWLVYEHRSIHRGNLPSPVWDDYSFNVSLSRKLFPVDRLRLRGQVESDSEIEIAFWSEGGSVVVRRAVMAGQPFQISCFEGVPTDGLPVSENRPIALRLGSDSTSVVGLIIERFVEYRLRPHDNHQRYPLELGPAEWFLLGDNVPVSVDSRDWGPVSESSLLGRVRSRKPAIRSLVFPIAVPR